MRTGQNLDHRTVLHVPLTHDRRLVPVYTLVWNSDGYTEWNEIHEMQVQPRSHGMRVDLKVKEDWEV